jgi:hypothetical protein
MIPSKIVIDPEFEKLIRPLSKDERRELQESLSSCGLLMPLVVWNTEGKTILVDGHNRLSLWKEFNGFNEEYEFKTQELCFGNRDNAKEWIIKNQLGRRNLSPKDFKLLVGMLYNQRKKAVGSVNQHTVAKGQIDPQQKQDSTAGAVAAETGVSPATVKRAGKLAAAVEAIQAAEPELPREEVIAKATKPVAKPKPKLSLEKLLTKRWKSFIKDIAVTEHTDVRLWLTAKLKEAAL